VGGMTVRLLRTLIVFVVGLFLLVPSVAVAAVERLEMAAPGGRFAVGVVTRHLVDAGRADPWVPERRRELMVSVWYPALPSRRPIAPYVSAEESALILEHAGATGVPADVLSTVVTHARVGAPRLPGLRPLVVLSPGFTLARSSLTGLAEELASRGYVVAAVDHTYEAAAITFPDGRITGCLICRGADGKAVSASRAKDVSFVLDELRGLYDPRRVAMVGHSLGGSAAASTMLSDPRVRVGVNLDGTFHPAIPGLDRPFLMVGNEKHGVPGDDVSWGDSWAHLTGRRGWVSVTGTKHFSFTDFAPLGDRVGLPQQTLAGDRCLEITRSLVVDWIGRRLVRAYPEVIVRG
jgi:predicted dienelactone hydrolase